MKDCPGRWADHPASTPTFHQVTRRCAKCLREGCVVPRCRRYNFQPTSWQEEWTQTPAGGKARHAWRCLACGANDAPPA